ncbi:RmlC-like cupin [Eremomyces bilateralis CBS 781.70]|uniref:RmlC-like cupin n=1 Tax=Eremomyces bilateralis CBS 781.70 TaxID=1392243 RepID=A0A6G1FUS3_9PEZI|nr:RmlC-like cupin [Eremomyces bilateralis CBS 781.70]KAF1809456.1 RmlC-like cupin [Eremomyces bilateralis CBS 781.70]
MYSQSHFHTTADEVLCVSSGSAELCFGGEDNTGRVETTVEKGDVMIVPAGVLHRLMADKGGFQMVGSYPKGCDWDMCYGKKGEEEKIQKIKDLPWFSKDPIYGDDGPVCRL